MFITVNGARLFFDVDGAALVPDGRGMRQKPTLLLLHGGPGFDHSGFKPAFSQLTDLCQIVYLDHRGNGRSDYGDPVNWTLPQWGDDVRAFCDALGIERPIVYGVSFGGFVAQSYATRHPDHPGKLVLCSTSAKQELPMVLDAFERIGGKPARALAELRWTAPTAEIRREYQRVCHPLYNTQPERDPDRRFRAIQNDAVGVAFRTDGMDFRADLARITCPTLVMAGDADPITPIAFSEVIAGCLPQHLLQFERFPNAGHGVVSDAPDRAFAVLRAFIES